MTQTEIDRSRAAVPVGMRVYAVGDVHGRSDLLAEVLSRIDADLAQYPVHRSLQIFLGDYVDRGPDSHGVIDLLVARSRSHDAVFLRGNHEAFLEDFLQDPSMLGEWRRYGGIETLMSYGIAPPFRPTPQQVLQVAEDFRRALPPEHLAWLSGLRSHLIVGDFLFVHAGIKPGLPIDSQSDADLLWIRDEFLNSHADFGKIVVHGHTVVAEPEIRSNRINLDTGAFATGRLTCLALEGQELRWIS